ncbi:hypothetical protein A6D6_02821 [Alcanivorax xiamenensis]|uniref:Preprotein translocase subunit YajC n=1 Tax=Alcanivorax xiamenensis TaxID=1177156 RepID=A0ABQ6Y640_9GAMM|nr:MULTISPECIES: PP0621 family protein [Alcanivorax]KAF0804787.1 hypothetical protein A6D6_02821 [Alcanivorax xiamenensis]
MGLIKLVILAALIYVVWRVVKGVSANQAARGRDPRRSSRTIDSERMVKCHLCGVHVPEAEAFRHQSLDFCSREHRREYLEHQESDD